MSSLSTRMIVLSILWIAYVFSQWAYADAVRQGFAHAALWPVGGFILLVIFTRFFSGSAWFIAYMITAVAVCLNASFIKPNPDGWFNPTFAVAGMYALFGIIWALNYKKPNAT